MDIETKTRRIAAIGDPHGSIDELVELYNLLLAENVDEIWHLGDLVDRGKDSGAVVEFCRLNGIKGVQGNHESALVNHYSASAKPGSQRSPHKRETAKSIRSEEDWEYLKNLPHLHVFDDLQVVLVHAGLFPGLPLYRQPPQAVNHLQMINPSFPGGIKWWIRDKDGVLEEEHRKNGWRRWYEVYDGDYTVVYGHSVFPEPHVYGKTIGIDTGCVFGGKLTAVILPDMRFVSVKAKKVYFDRRRTDDR